MKIDIVYIGEETFLYINEEYYIHGDNYHDKMSEWVEGFMGGILYMTLQNNKSDNTSEQSLEIQQYFYSNDEMISIKPSRRLRAFIKKLEKQGYTEG